MAGRSWGICLGDPGDPWRLHWRVRRVRHRRPTDHVDWNAPTSRVEFGVVTGSGQIRGPRFDEPSHRFLLCAGRSEAPPKRRLASGGAAGRRWAMRPCFRPVTGHSFLSSRRRSAKSVSSQSSAMSPSRKRLVTISRQTTGRPVAGKPLKGPSCVARIVRCQATRVLAVTRISTSTSGPERRAGIGGVSAGRRRDPRPCAGL